MFTKTCFIRVCVVEVTIVDDLEERWRNDVEIEAFWFRRRWISDCC